MKINYFFLGMILCMLIVISIGIYDTQNTKLIKGECFDRSNNKIDGLTCDVPEYPIADGYPFLFPVFIFYMFVFMCLSLLPPFKKRRVKQ